MSTEMKMLVKNPEKASLLYLEKYYAILKNCICSISKSELDDSWMGLAVHVHVLKYGLEFVAMVRTELMAMYVQFCVIGVVGEALGMAGGSVVVSSEGAGGEVEAASSSRKIFRRGLTAGNGGCDRWPRHRPVSATSSSSKRHVSVQSAPTWISVWYFNGG